VTESFPKSNLYLIHGNLEAEVSNVRYQLVCQLLTPEERDAGLAEVQGPGNQPLKLDRCLNEIIEELGTSSFLPGAKRVCVIYDLQELYGSGGGAKAETKAPKKPKKAGAGPARDREEILREWLEKSLPSTGNIAIFVVNENDEKRKMLSRTGTLARFLLEKGVVIDRSEKPLNFEFESHLLEANTVAALQVFREWVHRAGGDSGSRGRIYATLANAVELLVEARMVQQAKVDGIPERFAVVEDVYPRLAAVPPWKAKKYHDLARRHSVESVRALSQAGNRLQRVLYPSGEEAYVPDWEGLAEEMILRVTMRHVAPDRGRR
jgi:hypothetical protein